MGKTFLRMRFPGFEDRPRREVKFESEKKEKKRDLKGVLVYLVL